MQLQTLLLALPFAGAVRLRPRAEEEVSGQVVAPDKYIVEISTGDVDSLATKLESSGATIRKVFKSDVFNGLSIESPHTNLDDLLSLDEVAQAWPVTLHWVDPLVGEKLDFGDISASNYSVHSSTGVDKLHAEGITGKGVKVAVVDTGVDYRHPALGGCFGAGCKVFGGYDLVGDGYWNPGDPRTGDDDPIDTLNGHGTHVAGIVAGSNDWFKGVAPDATLMAYKISNPDGVSDSDTIMEAFAMAYEDGADVITCSFGGVDGWHTNPWALLASRIVEKGVVVTISAGNGGDNGPFWASSGSSGDLVLAVASVDPSITAAEPLGLTVTESDGTSDSTVIAYRTLRYFVDEPVQPVIALNFTNSKPGEFFCDPLPDDTPDLTGYAVLAVWQERCEPRLWMTQLRDRGVASIITYDSKNHDLVAPWYWHFGLNVGMVEEDAAKAMEDALASGSNVTVEYMENAGFNVSAPNLSGGYASSFTSWGGLYDMRIKPDVAAPGGSIFSTFPDDGWQVLSGTSMACPYVAGVAALYISKFGGRDVHGEGFGKMMFDRIISSASPLSWPEYEGSYPKPSKFNAPVPQVGNGYVNAWKLMNTRTELAFDKFHLNDTHHFSRYHAIDITNNDETEVTYEFDLQPAAGFEIQSPLRSYEIGVFGDMKPIEMVPKVKMPAGTQRLQPGQTKRVEFIFEYPIADESKLPIYSGNIVVRGTNGDVLQVPYMGAAFNTKRELKELFAPNTPYQYSGPNADDIDEYHEYAFDLESQDFPKVDMFIKWGTSQLRWDIFESDYKRRDWKQWPLVPGENGYVGSATYSTLAFRYGGRDWNPRYLEDEIANFPLQLQRCAGNTPRTFWWFGKLANGTQIAPGEYVMRVAALLPFGDPTHEDNWDVWETPIITVKAKE